MRSAPAIVTLAVAAALATASGGWWTVPLVAACWAGALPIRRPVVGAGIGGALGWGLLVGWTALHGPVAKLAARVGPIFHAPPWALVLATLLYPALLAGAAAGVVRPRRRRDG